MKLIAYFYLLFCCRSVHCALPFFDKTAVVEGEPFTIVCDYLRCDGIPEHVKSIKLISILKITPNASRDVTALAYIAANHPSQDDFKSEIPDGRNWKPSFHSENRTDNMFSINVTLTVMDTRVEDSGLYVCRLSYIANKGDFERTDCDTSVFLSVSKGERTTKSSPRNHCHFIFTRETQAVVGLYFIWLAAWLR